MDSIFKIYLDRAKNEINIAEIAFLVSQNKSLQFKFFKIENPETYYSSVITHCYYSIFYSAKAYLLRKGIRTRAPEEHRKTYEKFRKLVLDGTIDLELLEIYDDLLVKADSLLEIFKSEKRKRGKFTYRKLSQANRTPAEESLNKSKLFFGSIYQLLSNSYN
jgi:uncharacterized protein (UPF0332 family)